MIAAVAPPTLVDYFAGAGAGAPAAPDAHFSGAGGAAG